MALAEVRELSKRYGRRTAVQGVDFDVEEGSIVALLGPNGAGKTTTIKCLLGLARPDSGVVRVLGVEVKGQLPRDVAAKVGYVPETPEAPPWLTPCELLEYLAMMEGVSSFEARVLARKALALMGAEDLCGKRLGSLSKGERKRVLVAQAFLQPRSLYVMDEPLAGLDAEWVAETRRLIVSAARGEGAGVLVSSHLLREVEDLADSVVVLRQRLLYRGPLEGLLEALSRSNRVVVETPQAKEAVVALRERGFRAEMIGGRSVAVYNSTVEDVVDALRGRVRIDGVRVEKPSLEEAYLALVRGEGLD